MEEMDVAIGWNKIHTWERLLLLDLNYGFG